MAGGEQDRPLDSWKHIGEYLGCDERTVRRWEKERALPVRRVPGKGRRAVFAYRHEIDAWLREPRGASADPGINPAPTSLSPPSAALSAPNASAQPAPTASQAPNPSLDAQAGRRPSSPPTIRTNAPRPVQQTSYSSRWPQVALIVLLLLAGVTALALLRRGRRHAAPPDASGLVVTEPVVAHAPVRREDTPWKPEVLEVRFHGEPGDLGIELAGLGFGQVGMRLPFAGDVRWFHIGNVTCYGKTPGRCEAGYTGDVLPVTYGSWSDNRIAISHYAAAAPGDALELVVWNPQSGNRQDAAVWGGNVPLIRPRTPQVSKVAFRGAGKGLEITIEGKHFGKAPPGLPGAGNTGYLEIGDFAFHSPRVPFSTFFRAGYANRRTVDTITLVFSSWTDNKIVIGGFAGACGQNGMVVRSGDPISIELWSTKSHLATAWGGRVP